MKKITYIISDIDKAMAFEWIATRLNKSSFDLNFILLNPGNSKFEDFLTENKLPFKRIHLYSGWKLIFSFIALWFTLLKKHPDIIHTHLRYASLFGISAGYLAGVKKRIHTRHHAASNHYYYPHAVKHDHWISKLSTHIVSISDVVSEVLIGWERTPLNKVIKIPHGFDLNLFSNPDQNRVNGLRKKYIPNIDGPVIGMISRYMHLKGIEYCTDAFKKILNLYPNAHLILANASGPNAMDIKDQLKLLPNRSYTEITFEPDISSLYQLFDVFVHIPISRHSEAFGQTYIEALASGIPAIVTLSGIANEFIIDRENALVVPYRDSLSIYNGIEEILSKENLRQKLKNTDPNQLSEFTLDKYIHRLENLYSNG